MDVALGKPPSASELTGTAMVICALLIHTAASRRTAAPQLSKAGT
jgi:hypothetical protein